MWRWSGVLSLTVAEVNGCAVSGCFVVDVGKLPCFLVVAAPPSRVVASVDLLQRSVRWVGAVVEPAVVVGSLSGAGCGRVLVGK